jgi:hypothetical protein
LMSDAAPISTVPATRPPETIAFSVDWRMGEA